MGRPTVASWVQFNAEAGGYDVIVVAGRPLRALRRGMGGASGTRSLGPLEYGPEVKASPDLRRLSEGEDPCDTATDFHALPQLLIELYFPADFSLAASFFSAASSLRSVFADSCSRDSRRPSSALTWISSTPRFFGALTSTE